MSFTTSISGIGRANFTGADYTNAALLQSFLASLSEFYQVKTGTAPLTSADLAKIQDQVNFLAQLAQNGMSVNLDPSAPGNPTAGGSNPGTSPNRTYYLTTGMVEVLSNLFSSISQVGDVNNLTLADLNDWRNGTTTQNANDIQNIFVLAAAQYATLPILASTISSAHPNGVVSAISLNPASAAGQIARIFGSTNSFATASSINFSATKSMQSFTELQYVETANQVINKQLENMQQALQTTQDALNNLNQLQQVHNKITVNSRTFTYNLLPPSSQINANPISIDTYVTQYERYASAQLKAALVPQLNTEFLPFSLPASAITIAATSVGTGLTANWSFQVTINDPSKYYAFNTSTNQFSAVHTVYMMSGYYVSSLSVNPANFTQAQMSRIVGDGFNGTQKFPLLGTLSGISVLQEQLARQKVALSTLLAQLSLSTITPLSVLDNPLKRSQALVGQISAVLNDLQVNISTINSTSSTLADRLIAAVGVRKWVMDNYQTFSSPSATNAGAIQQNITNAINAAQSSNSTQTQKVNNSLLVFQQYYQSAAAVLSQLTQIITKMAQKISQ